MSTVPAEFERRLELHLRAWAGAWPAPSEGLNVVGDPARLEPTWDGSVRKLQGVGDGRSTVIAVPPNAVGAVAALVHDVVIVLGFFASQPIYSTYNIYSSGSRHML